MKKHLPYLILILIILLLSFCAGPTESDLYTSFNLSDSVAMQFRDMIFNSEENIWITFDSVLEDSRCPVNVACFWAGNAKLGFTFAKGENKIPFLLNTHGGRFPGDTTLLGYKIFLLDVKPYRHTDSTFTQKDYSAIIVVSN